MWTAHGAAEGDDDEKKILAILLFLSCVFLVFAQETSELDDKKSEEITNLYLKTGLSFTHFSINGNKFYNYYDSSYAPMIVEIISVDKDLYKVVYAEPMNKAGSLRYVTLYIETGDLIAIRLPYSDTIGAGIVINGKANIIELKGMIKE